MDDGTDQLYKGPNGEALRIFPRALKNNFQSEKHGKPIFDNALMVEVIVPGSQESSPEFELERTYCPEAGTGDGPDGRIVQRGPKYDEYADAIAKYKSQNGEGLIAGTPIHQWPQIDAGTAATLKASGVYTVEMLAQVHDGLLPNLGIAGRTLREQARAFLNTREFSVPSAQMGAEVANLRGEVDRLTAELAIAHAEINRLRLAGEAQPAAAPVLAPAPAPTLETPAAPVVDFTGDPTVLGDPAPAAPAPVVENMFTPATPPPAPEPAPSPTVI